MSLEFTESIFHFCSSCGDNLTIVGFDGTKLGMHVDKQATTSWYNDDSAMTTKLAGFSPPAECVRLFSK